MAELLRRSNQLPISKPICRSLDAAVAALLAPQIAEGPLLIGQPYGPQKGTLAQARNPTPVAEPTIRRQHNPREEPDALAGMSGSVRGVPSNGDPYRDQHPWVRVLPSEVHPQAARIAPAGLAQASTLFNR